MQERRGPAVEVAIDELIAQMTLEEKVGMCHAESAFCSGGVERLGIPPLVMSDGPHGVRQELDPQTWDPVAGADDAVSYLPVGTALAATWNPERARDFGEVLGAEARARGKDVILGPGINIVRTPLCGRNFEYYGEDPHLICQLVVPMITACQEHDVAACVKHYALNNQELDRFHVDVECDERALREIYLPGFAAAVREAGVLTLMGAYNKFRGEHCCHNDYLLNTVLKGEWSFDYLVVSDWGGTHDTGQAARNGLDIEMGGDLNNLHLAGPFRAGLANGTYDTALVDDKVRRILRVMYAVGKFDPADRAAGARNTERHRQLARRIADEAIVLLKNDNAVLPLDPDTIRTLAVIGDNADRTHAQGGGSSAVVAHHEITPLSGLRELLGDAVRIVHVRGYPNAPAGMEPIPTELLAAPDAAGIGGWRRELYANRRFRDEPVAVSTVPTVALGGDDLPQGLQPGRWSAIWRGRVTPTVSGTYHLVISGGDSYDLRVDEVSVASAWGLACHGTRVETIELTAGTSYAVEVRLNPAGEDGALQFGWIRPDAPGDHAEDPHAAAVAAAREADAVLVFAGSTHLEDCEGSDRKNFALPGDQDALIAKLAAANPRTAVFLTGGSAVALPWADEVPAIVQSYYAGMEGGHAVAAVACGRVNPSGKLAFTWPVRLEDCAAHALGEYATQRTVYREGWKVGYRWTTGAGPAPRFCFGHGLSYSSFALEDAELESGRADAVATIRCTLRNTGQHAGGEVVQLYLEDPVCSVERPARELKRFAKVFLEPGASQQVVLSVSADDLAFYDEQAGRWRAEPGDFIAHLGTSVDDIRISLPFLWEG